MEKEGQHGKHELYPEGDERAETESENRQILERLARSIVDGSLLETFVNLPQLQRVRIRLLIDTLHNAIWETDPPGDRPMPDQIGRDQEMKAVDKRLDILGDDSDYAETLEDVVRRHGWFPHPADVSPDHPIASLIAEQQAARKNLEEARERILGNDEYDADASDRILDDGFKPVDS